MQPQKIRKQAINTNPIKYGDEKFYSSISLNTFRGVEKLKGKKEFLRIEKPTNIIKKKIVLEKRKEVTKILNRLLKVIVLNINKEILSSLTYAYQLKAFFFPFW